MNAEVSFLMISNMDYFIRPHPPRLVFSLSEVFLIISLHSYSSKWGEVMLHFHLSYCYCSTRIVTCIDETFRIASKFYLLLCLRPELRIKLEYDVVGDSGVATALRQWLILGERDCPKALVWSWPWSSHVPFEKDKTCRTFIQQWFVSDI